MGSGKGVEVGGKGGCGLAEEVATGRTGGEEGGLGVRGAARVGGSW